MATGTGNTLGELEYSWFAQRSGLASNAPLGDHKFAYWVSQVTGGNEKDLDDLERRWLRKYISDQGETPTNTQYLSTLWREAVVASGETPSDTVGQNKWIFYSTVA